MHMPMNMRLGLALLLTLLTFSLSLSLPSSLRLQNPALFRMRGLHRRVIVERLREQGQRHGYLPDVDVQGGKLCLCFCNGGRLQTGCFQIDQRTDGVQILSLVEESFRKLRKYQSHMPFV